MRAFGADFRNLNDEQVRTVVDVYSGDSIISSLTPPVGPLGNLRFWGFVADGDENVTEIRFRWEVGDGYGFDDIEISSISGNQEPPVHVYRRLNIPLIKAALDKKSSQTE